MVAEEFDGAESDGEDEDFVGGLEECLGKDEHTDFAPCEDAAKSDGEEDYRVDPFAPE